MGKTIFITGSSGMIGSALVEFLKQQRDDVKKVVRRGAAVSQDAVLWDPENGKMDLAAFEGADAVVNLAGENLMGLRWTEAKKQRIRNSRVKGTKLLCDALSRLKQPPKVLVSGSAIGYYGNRGSAEVSEQSQAGSGFLAEVCREWEAATQKAAERGIRVVNLRTGVVLTPLGGALAQMLTPFKLGLGGVIGSGEQYMSWITLDDLVRVIVYAIENHLIEGPLNAVAPNPVTNREFTKKLGSILNRPTVFPLPAFVARLIFGELADEMLLNSTRAIPKKLIQSGFMYHNPDLSSALQTLLDKI